ncbi:PepSY-like domain-containing protein [Fibrella arboris]|uniref:PepSY-like domain-containing protein n=1 Tax=Fibrella arboris TaxID=3242486 RepID=UPI00352065DD
MKPLLIAALLGVGTAASTRPASPMTGTLKDTTPAAVKAAIAKLYPTAKNVKYSKENADYEVGFKQNGKSMSVVLDAKGVVKETETVIGVSALPAVIRDYVAKKAPGKKITEAAEIVDAKGVKTYEAEVGGKDLLFDAAGKPIK